MCKTLIYLSRDGNAKTALGFLEHLPETLDLEGTPPINYVWVLAEMVEGRYPEALKRLSLGSSEIYRWATFLVPKDLLRAQIHGLMERPQLRRAHYEEARLLLEKAVAEDPTDSRLRGPLGVAYAGLGRRDAAIREGKRGLELLAGAQHPSFGFLLKDMAQIHTMLGDEDEAIDRLEQLLSVPNFFSAAFLQADPTWEPLHENPRFRALLKAHSEPIAVRQRS